MQSSSSIGSNTTHISPPILRPRASILTFETALTHQRSMSSSIDVDTQTQTQLHSPSSLHLSEYDASDLPDLEPETFKHQDLWFTDGSVVLRAEDTLYKVHISQLSRHSAFFRDLFELPQPQGQEDRVRQKSSISPSVVDNDGYMEGCPIVYLHDRAEDVGNLLTALYDGPSFGTNSPADFRIVSGILRLSTKYLCDSLRAKALSHLSVAWPSDLRGWDTREDQARYWELEMPEQASIGIYPSPIAVINLANEIDAPSLLPSAFYDLSRHSYAHIFEPLDMMEDSQSQFHHTSHNLSLHDIQKLTLGKEASHQAITSLIRSMGNNSVLHHPLPQHHHSHSHSHSHSTGLPPHLGLRNAKACASAAACRKDFTELVELATQHYLFDRERGCEDPLYVAEELGQLKSAEMSGSECKACAKMLEIWAMKEREKIWRLIPTWFRLEGA